MVTIKKCQGERLAPKCFFPNVSPQMKQFFWQRLTVENSTVHDALMQYLSRSINTPIELEVAGMIAESLEEYWETYLVADRIKNAISTSKLCCQS